MMQNYMGLKEPYYTTWFNGAEVIVYPDGRVVRQSDGEVIRAKSHMWNRPYQSTQSSSAFGSGLDPTLALVVGVIAIVGIVAIVAVNRRA